MNSGKKTNSALFLNSRIPQFNTIVYRWCLGPGFFLKFCEKVGFQVVEHADLVIGEIPGDF